MKPFQDLTYRGQLRRLRRLAEHVLVAYGLEGAHLAPLSNTENMTFQVRSPDGERFVLRIHRSNRKPEQEIASELMWLEAIRRDTLLQVPDPVRTASGALVVLVELDGVPGPRPCVLFHWLDGHFRANQLGPDELEQIGDLMARLHDHATRFMPPPGFTRNRLAHESVSPESRALDALKAHMPPQDIALLAQAGRRIAACMQALGEGPEVFGLIHADLHAWNVLFHHGEIRAIDFDDCCWSYHLYDMATTLSYLQGHRDYPALYGAFLAGYRAVRPFSQEHESLLEAFFILRRLLMLPWLLESRHEPSLQEWARVYIPESLQAIGAFVAT